MTMGIYQKILNNTKRYLKIGDIVKIDSGVDRDVYQIITNKFNVGNMNYNGKIIKIDENIINNKAEIETWQHFKSTEFKQFFCPIRDMSSDKRVIVMDKVNVVNSNTSSSKEILTEMQNIATNNLELSSSEVKQNALDIHTKNIGIHPEYGKVFIDYPWGSYFNYKNILPSEMN